MIRNDDYQPTKSLFNSCCLLNLSNASLVVISIFWIDSVVVVVVIVEFRRPFLMNKSSIIKSDVS